MKGSTLSHYLIKDELGRGGMGIVYRAEDTKLHRIVAIKVLPAAALASDDDRARFYREARAAAALTHPNIAVIHEIDEAVPEGAPEADSRPFIAMEFIEGKTLEARIKEGPLKLEEAVRLASEIAQGLKAAHAKDIVHRDIKASNVMLDGDGRAKILDFGLALTAQSTKLTRMGSTLGTVAYMSPEQARGEEVDGRTDIWALGVVLYEMIAGRHPFAGDYEQAVVYSILNEDPEPLTALRTGVPMGLEWIVGKMLAKRAEQRYQSLADLLVDLQTVDLSAVGMSRVSTVSSAATPAPFTPHGSRPRMVRRDGLILIVAILLTAVGMWAFMPDAGPDYERSLEKLNLHFEGIKHIEYPIMSPDRSAIYFNASDTLDQRALYRYDLASGATSISEGQAADAPVAVSPDGKNLAFSSNGLRLKRGPFADGELIDPSGDWPIWLNNNIFLFNRTSDDALYSYDLESEKIETFIPSDTSNTRGFSRWIYSLHPEHNGMIVGHEYVGGRPADLYWFDFETRTETEFWVGGINSYFVGGSHLIYQTGGNSDPWMAQPFDIESKRLLGQPVQIYDAQEYPTFSVSKGGDMLIAEPDPCRAEQLSLARLDTGMEIPISTLEGGCLQGTGMLSPDGSTTVSSMTEKKYDLANKLVLIDVASGEVTWFKSDSEDRYPTFSADGEWIYYSKQTRISEDIWRIRISGLDDQLVLEDGLYALASQDQQTVVYRRGSNDGYELRLRDLSSNEDRLLDQTPTGGLRFQFSPDEQHLIYSVGGTGYKVVNLESGISRTVSASGYAQWGSNSSTLWLVDQSGWYRMSIMFDGTDFVLGDRKSISAGFKPGVKIFPTRSGSDVALFARDVDPFENRTHAVLQWWRNFDTVLEQIAPTPRD